MRGLLGNFRDWGGLMGFLNRSLSSRKLWFCRIRRKLLRRLLHSNRKLRSRRRGKRNNRRRGKYLKTILKQLLGSLSFRKLKIRSKLKLYRHNSQKRNRLIRQSRHNSKPTNKKKEMKPNYIKSRFQKLKQDYTKHKKTYNSIILNQQLKNLKSKKNPLLIRTTPKKSKTKNWKKT